MTIQLGDKVRCLVTGFEGIVTGRTEYINGCVQILVRPKAITTNDGEMKMVDGEWIDVDRLKVIDGRIDLTKKMIPGSDVPASKNWG